MKTTRHGHIIPDRRPPLPAKWRGWGSFRAWWADELVRDVMERNHWAITHSSLFNTGMCEFGMGDPRIGGL